MPVVLPLRPSIGAYRFTLQLEDVQYRFRLKWNSVERPGSAPATPGVITAPAKGMWYMDIAEFDGTPILAGVKIVLGSYLGRWSNHPLILNGVFVARSSAPIHDDPGFDDLGVTVQVLYFNRADLAAEMLGAFSEAT